MSLISRTDGNHFRSPWLLLPSSTAVGNLSISTDAPTVSVASTTAFFTEMAATRGIQDTTNWSANTYKTLLSISSGFGLVAGVVGCTAGGAETTTFEFTIDGVISTITTTNASGERTTLLAGGPMISAAFTTINLAPLPMATSMDAGKSQLIAANSALFIPGWPWITMAGVPCLRFNTSLLIRAKHSTSITNSTATAYSGVMYRAGIAS